MNRINYLLLCSLLLFSPCFAQEEDSESESEENEDASAAESAVIGSVSAPSLTPSGSIESNLIIDYIRKKGKFPGEYAWIFQLPITDLDLQDALISVAESFKVTEGSEYQVALTEAAILANSLLQDRVITTTSSVPSAVSTASFTEKGYNLAFLHILSKYGALGPNGDNLITEITDGILSDSISNLSSTADYLSNLATFTGSATFGKLIKNRMC